MADYSVYTYEGGSLKVFGNKSKRSHFKTVAEAVSYVQQYILRMSKLCAVQPAPETFWRGQKQVVVVEYNDDIPQGSRIVGIINNSGEEIQTLYF